MKKKRSIIIKTPQLRKFRNNLRALYFQVSKIRIHQLREERRKAYKEKDPVRFTIESKKNALDSSFHKSICYCSKCYAFDKDMTYNPLMKEWFCVDCYQELHEYYKRKSESYLFP